MITEFIQEDSCVGCNACFNICPKKCITMTENKEGFENPLIDKNACIECKLCEKVCPLLNKIETSSCEPPNVYAMWSLDKETRMESTSGGVFTELANVVLKRGGEVVGARYDESNMVSHCIINRVEDIALLRQSKYCQSQKGNILSEVKERLDKGTEILFVGAPCEIAGLKAFLRKDYENLILCDFICRGSNSLKAYRSYLKYIEKKYNSKVQRVWFKEKKYGWNNFSTKVIMKNGRVYRKDRYTDYFMRGYIEDNLYIRKCCSDCHFKGFPRLSDITLGDFWGVGHINRNLDFDLGTSLVVVNTKKGKALYKDIINKVFCEKVDFERAISKKSCAYTSIKHSLKREEFLEKLEEDSFDELAKKYIKKSMLNECMRKCYNSLRWIRRKIRICIQKMKNK